MPFLEIDYEKVEIDLPRYNDAVRKYILKKMFSAGQAFVRAAIPRVPVDTGMARGTFLNVGKLLKVTIPIFPKSTNKIYDNHGTILPKQPETGAQLAIHPDRVIRQEGDTFYFEFDQNVWHYNLNEFFGGHAPTAPWQSYIAGVNAFEVEFKKDFLRDFPQIDKYVNRSSLTGLIKRALL